jgi:hypothetical protein
MRLPAYDAGDDPRTVPVLIASGPGGDHYALLPCLSPDAAAPGSLALSCALALSSEGRALRRLGPPGALARIRPDRPDMLRLDWRPGRPARADEAGELLRGVASDLDRPALARLAGALDGGISVSRRAGRRGSWSVETGHHPDILADALSDVRAGRHPAGALAWLGREPAPGPPPSPHPNRLLVSKALAAALADVLGLDPEPYGPDWRPATSAARPPYRKPEARFLADADLPEWVLSLPLDGLPIPPGLAGSLSRLGATAVGDLLGLHLARISAPGLDAARIERLRDAIDDMAVSRTPPAPAPRTRPAHPRPVRATPVAVAQPAPPPAEAPGPTPGPAAGSSPALVPEPPPVPPVLPLLVGIIDAMPPRHAAMMRALAGLDGPAASLGGAAEASGYTLERARQILVRLQRRLVADPRGLALIDRFHDLLEHTPIRLDALAREGWAEGMSAGTVDFLVRRLVGHPLKLAVDDDAGEVLVTPMATSGWTAAVREARRAMAGIKQVADRRRLALSVMHALTGLPEANVASVIAHLLPPGFVPPPPSASALLLRILSEPGRSLTFEEAWDAIAADAGREVSSQQVMRALDRVAVRGTDGTYALPPVVRTDPGLAAAVEDILRILRRGGGLRHWSSNELLEALPRRHRTPLAPIGPRGVDALLMGDGRFARTKSGSWLAAKDGKPPPRPKVSAWAERIVANTGRPLGTDELAEIVTRERGAMPFSTFQETGRMVRVAPGTWGLHDRDLGLGVEEVARIAADADAALAGGTLGIADLHARIARSLPDSVTPPVLASLFLLVPDGPRMDKAGAVRPAGRRPDASGRLHTAILAAVPDAAGIEDVIVAVRDATGKAPSRTHVLKIFSRERLRLVQEKNQARAARPD